MDAIGSNLSNDRKVINQKAYLSHGTVDHNSLFFYKFHEQPKESDSRVHLFRVGTKYYYLLHSTIKRCAYLLNLALENEKSGAINSIGGVLSGTFELIISVLGNQYIGSYSMIVFLILEKWEADKDILDAYKYHYSQTTEFEMGINIFVAIKEIEHIINYDLFNLPTTQVGMQKNYVLKNATDYKICHLINDIGSCLSKYKNICQTEISHIDGHPYSMLQIKIIKKTYPKPM